LKRQAAERAPSKKLTMRAFLLQNYNRLRFGTVRGRAGALVTPNTLLYATGGWAYGHTTTSASAALLGVGAATSIGSNQNGWAVGGGLEYAFNSWLSFKTEYLYVDLGTSTLVSGGGGGVPFSLSEKATAHTVKAGINIKLGDLARAGCASFSSLHISRLTKIAAAGLA
jgi:opacity protein-like surface antigen